MVKPLLTLKPSPINALVPMFVRNLVYSSIVAVVVYIILFIAKSPNTNLISIITLSTFTLLPLLIKQVILYNTRYYFYPTFVTSEFEFIKVNRHSVPYNKISNITVNISLWDRLCRAGGITLHTADETAPNLILQYIKDPRRIERGLHNLVHKKK